jgi:hypothetical protein
MSTVLGKEINQIGRAGANIQENIERAIKAAMRAGSLERTADFLKRPGSRRQTFRTPGDDVHRPLARIPPEEIELVVLFIVAD